MSRSSSSSSSPAPDGDLRITDRARERLESSVLSKSPASEGESMASDDLVPEPFGPLQGVKILSTGTLIAEPFAAHLAAAFGAEVIHVEHPSGTVDPWRAVNGSAISVPVERIFTPCNG